MSTITIEVRSELAGRRHVDLTPLRRALIRHQARQTTRRIIIEALALHTEPRHNRQPLFARLDALQTRYAALGGDPADLLR
jgi:hypothetical protein